MKLNKIPVQFFQEEHRYFNVETGVELQGITSTLIHRLFPDKYANIPQAVLQRAADKGTLVHEEIELTDSVGIEPTTPEAKNYVKIKQKHKLKYLTSEHTVSDLEHYATNIDSIYQVNKSTVDIADFKTTYKLDKESVSWQLSICAYFFELNNPDIKVRKLYAIWLRGEDIAELVEVERKTDEQVKELIKADINNEEIASTTSADATINEYIESNEQRIIYLTNEIKRMQDELSSLKDDTLKLMIDNDVKSADTGKLLVTVVAPQQRSTFDTKRFKSDNEELYKQYIKTAQTSASLKITIR